MVLDSVNVYSVSERSVVQVQRQSMLSTIHKIAYNYFIILHYMNSGKH